DKPRCHRSDDLHRQKTRHIRWPDTGKGVRQGASKRHRWVGKRGGRGKPVSASYVSADSKRRRLGSKTGATPDNGQQSKSRDQLAEKLRPSGAGVLRSGKNRLTKHEVSCSHSKQCPNHLRKHVTWNLAPGKTTFRRPC